MLSLVLILFCGSDIPHELLLALQRRDELVGSFHAVSYGRGTEAYRSRGFARHNQLAVISDGTRSGSTGVHEDGRPAYGLERGHLASPEGIYEKSLNVLGVSFQPDAPVVDIRLAGAFPKGEYKFGGLANLKSALLSGLRVSSEEDVSWTVSRDPSGTVRVEATAVDGTIDGDDQLTMHWVIDPATDWNIIECVQTSGDTVLSHITTAYERQGEVWVPAKVISFGQDGQIQEVGDMRWQFDGTSDRDELTLEHIGAWVGDHIWVDGKQMHWIGGMEFIPRKEYYERIRRGEIKEDERVSWRQKDPKPGFSYGTPPEPHPLRYKPPVYEMSVDEAAMRASLAQGEVRRRLLTQASYWQRYVARFIEKYELSADQSEKCMQILRDCQQRRDDYLRRKEKELTAISERKLEKKGDLVIAREELELLRPVEDVFTQLKKRLEPIPTRAQRAKADPPPASQPARAPVSQPSGAGAASQPAGAP